MRVFLPVDNVDWRTTDDIEARLDTLLQLMETDFRHMYLIVCLTNLYKDTAFKVFGDDEGDKDCYNVPWDKRTLLGRDWFHEELSGQLPEASYRRSCPSSRSGRASWPGNRATS